MKHSSTINLNLPSFSSKELGKAALSIIDFPFNILGIWVIFNLKKTKILLFHSQWLEMSIFWNLSKKSDPQDCVDSRPREPWRCPIPDCVVLCTGCCCLQPGRWVMVMVMIRPAQLHISLQWDEIWRASSDSIACYLQILSDGSESKTICRAIHQRSGDRSRHYPRPLSGLGTDTTEFWNQFSISHLIVSRLREELKTLCSSKWPEVSTFRSTMILL